MKRLPVKIGDRYLTQPDLIDDLGNDFKVFSRTDEDGDFRPIHKGMKVTVTYDINASIKILSDPCTGEKEASTILDAIDVQYARQTGNIGLYR